MDRDSACETFYEAVFRTQRGGKGIEFDAAAAELFAVLEPLGIRQRRPFAGRMWLQFDMNTNHEGRLIKLADRLGYTRAIVRATRLPNAGIGYRQRGRKTERIPVGDQRRDDDLLRYEPLWTADDAARRTMSPHFRQFAFIVDGQIVRNRKSFRRHRRLSVCDVCFLLNIAGVNAGDRIVEPFAGIGGIVLQARKRGIHLLCGDIDDNLRIGLREVSGSRCAIWDASNLPLPADCADAIVTEPPFKDDAHDAVLAAANEIARILRPAGTVALLVNERLARDFEKNWERKALHLHERHSLRRQGRISHALVFRHHQ